MKIGVLGTGMVGDAIASKLAGLSHDVVMGSRDANNAKAVAWVKRTGARARAGTFTDAAGFGEVLFNCTNGVNSIEALRAAGARNLEGKVLVDVANILPPEARTLESLGEQIQRAFPQVRVVKTLNTVNCQVMADPMKISGLHTMFMCGNDDAAKKTVRGLLEAFGWKDIIDLGEITIARATEAYMALWLALWKSMGTLDFNIRVVR
jgi:hypothetical protein